MKIRLVSSSKRNQQGMASLIVVSVLLVILTLITLGFAKLMDRALNNSVNSQLGSASYYAARSAISDVIAFLSVPANSGVSVNTCGDPVLKAIYDAGKLSDTTEYTCLLIDQIPKELIYQKIDAFKSQVVKIKPESGTTNSILLSWQSTNRENAATACNYGELLQQSAWASARCEPVLRVTIYPVRDDSAPLSSGPQNLESRAKTFFLYPSSSGVNQFSYIDPFVEDGSLAEIICNNTAPSPYGGGDHLHCNARITAMQSGGGAEYHYLRLTPLYQQADIKIKAATGGGPANIVGLVDAQAVIDVTAKSGTTVRRLAARVDTSAVGGRNLNVSPRDEGIPENAIRSAGTLCKRLLVNLPPGSTQVEGAYSVICNLRLL